MVLSRHTLRHADATVGEFIQHSLPPAGSFYINSSMEQLRLVLSKRNGWIVGWKVEVKAIA
jgi:hypothetical protein